MRIAGGVLTLDDGTIVDSYISNSTKIDADKMQHCYHRGTGFALAIGGTPATREEIVFTATQAGTIRSFNALCNDTGTAASVTFDLKKNGTTMLSSVITITNATTDKATQSATLSVTTFAAGDILSIALTVSTSTGMVGPYAWVCIEENAAP